MMDKHLPRTASRNNSQIDTWNRIAIAFPVEIRGLSARRAHHRASPPLLGGEFEPDRQKVETLAATKARQLANLLSREAG
jgi:hypothetical protein